MKENLLLRNLEQKQIIDLAYAKAQKLLSEYEIKITDFGDLYGASNIENDQVYVDKKEILFERQLSQEQKELLRLSTILEAIIFESIEQAEWFGNNTFTIKTSRFDDIKNGVDTVVEFIGQDRSASYLALALDATFNQDTQKKFGRIKYEIDRGKLAHIKYFISDNMNFRGELKNTPRAVVGTEIKTIKGLAELWLEKKNKDLSEHPVLFQILDELLVQFEAFARYATFQGKDEIAQKYKLAKTKILAILSQKNKTIVDDQSRDEVYYSIKSAAEAFNK